jgi:hypothetical protein
MSEVLSVIVCTHNPRADYLHRCMAGLQAQTLPPSQWELIVIDNGSSPDRAVRPELAWHGRARCIREEVLGLTPARLRGIREATGDVLVFVDDDNVLDADFLETALAIAADRAFLGAWSGQCRPEFETPPPEWSRRYWGNLVIREFDADVWSNLPRLAASMPCGAGLCVRRSVARHYLVLHETGQRAFQLDRTPTSLVSGGDNDLAACACDLGLGMGLTAALKLTHLIPPERLTATYLERLSEGIQLSSTLLDAERGTLVIPRPLRRIIDLLRIVTAGAPHRRILYGAYRGRQQAFTRLRAGRSRGDESPSHAL